ncbi:MAG: HAD family hydrolase [Terriglobales bacterium]
MSLEGQVLLLDADDTLWENNVYFERAIERFYALVEPGGGSRVARPPLAGAALPLVGLWPGVAPRQRTPAGAQGVSKLPRKAMRERINQEERRVIAEIGYGLESFTLALTRAFQALAPERWGPEARTAVGQLAASIAAEPIEFVPGAVETLRYLAPRHRLLLVTKGDFAEQSRKVALSGVAPLFEQVHVLPEKDEAAYRERLAALDARPESCWMIGNSPKSDINPALRAGLNAVLIPHPHTWMLEQDSIISSPGPYFLRLERIADLRLHF